MTIKEAKIYYNKMLKSFNNFDKHLKDIKADEEEIDKLLVTLDKVMENLNTCLKMIPNYTIKEVQEGFNVR